RYRLPLGRRKLLHDLHHVGVVGPITVSKAAHRLDQIFVALTGESRRRQAADEIRLMTNLTDGYSVRRRRRGGWGKACRPALFGEVSRRGAQLRLREAFGKG